MIYEPIIKAHQKKFAESNGLKSDNDDALFEKFAIYSELLQHQPDAFMSDSELLDLICIGGAGDGGIDGIAIKINGYFIKSIDEIDSFLKTANNIDIELIFIQAKNKKKFESDQIATFINGVRAFFDKDSKYPFNENVTYWRDIKNYLYTEDVLLQWNETPTVRCYYVTLGEVRDHPEHEDLIRQFKNDMITICDEPLFHMHGAQEFRMIIDQNQNKLKVKLPYIDTMALPGSNDIGNSCILLCKASDYISLINTKEGIIRKTLFNDNVRDFQGDNTINREIDATVCHSPEKFVLFNNGITIVCSSYKSENRILEIENPQIVNGCQSSYILFNAYKKNEKLDLVTLAIKLISTNNEELSNDIVRGTNRQNIVMEEAFEATKPFHKNFELFVTNYVADFPEKIYYERRAKQYSGNPSIKQYQKFNLRILTQYSVAALLHKPNKSHLHESYLLKEYKDYIYREKDSNLPYFAVAYSFLTLEKFIREGVIGKYFIKYKAHLLMIYFRLLGGKYVDLNNERAADKYANQVLKTTYNLDEAKTIFRKAVEIFRDAEKYWTETLQKSYHIMKESQFFTELIIKKMDSLPLDSLHNQIKDSSAIIYGTVTKIIYQGPTPYGFITTQKGEKIFFNCRRNKKLSIKGLLHKKVSFNATLKDGKDRRQAYNIQVVDENDVNDSK